MHVREVAHSGTLPFFLFCLFIISYIIIFYIVSFSFFHLTEVGEATIFADGELLLMFLCDLLCLLVAAADDGGASGFCPAGCLTLTPRINCHNINLLSNDAI